MITQGGHRIPGGHARHDRAVGYAQVVEAVNPQPAVDDSHFTAAHLCRAGLMPLG